MTGEKNRKQIKQKKVNVNVLGCQVVVIVSVCVSQKRLEMYTELKEQFNERMRVKRISGNIIIIIIIIRK